MQKPVKLNDSGHVYNQYTIKAENRDLLMKTLKDSQIGCAVYYPKPIHLLKHLKHYGYKKGDLPRCEKVCDQVLSIPIYPELATSELKHVAKTMEGI